MSYTCQGQFFYDRVLVWACAYYNYGVSLVDDEQFDGSLHELSYWWNNMKHPNKSLMKKGNFKTGSLFDIDFPDWCHACAKRDIKEHMEDINRVSESNEQIKLVQWAKRQRETCPDIRWLHHIPNGGMRNIHTGSKLKLEGVESGVFDLFLPVARWKKHGLYIEMKFENNKLSEKQIEFKKFVIEQGYATATCYTCEEGIKILKKYLGI